MSRVSARELKRLADQLSPRRRQLLEAVALVRIATGEQLRRRFYEGEYASAGRLSRLDLAALHEANVFHRFGHQAGGRRAGSSGYIYTLGPVGRRLLDHYAGEGIAPGRSRYEPSVGFIDHTLAVTEVWVSLHEFLVDSWTAQRDVHFDFFVERGAWRSYPTSHGRTATLKPDAELRVHRTEHDDHWWLEVDRNTERRSVLARKLRAYLEYFQSGQEQRVEGVFPQTAWLTTTEPRARVLQTLIEELPFAAQRLFTVGLLTAAAPTLLTPHRSES